MNTTSALKCDLIPDCKECKLMTVNMACDVSIPNYIPNELVDKMLQLFRKKHMK